MDEERTLSAPINNQTLTYVTYYLQDNHKVIVLSTEKDALDSQIQLPVAQLSVIC